MSKVSPGSGRAQTWISWSFASGSVIPISRSPTVTVPSVWPMSDSQILMPWAGLVDTTAAQASRRTLAHGDRIVRLDMSSTQNRQNLAWEADVNQRIGAGKSIIPADSRSCGYFDARIGWPRRDSNPHGRYRPEDFKSSASANSATRPRLQDSCPQDSCPQDSCPQNSCGP